MPVAFFVVVSFHSFKLRIIQGFENIAPNFWMI